MTIVYTTDVEGQPSANLKFLEFDVKILRSIDGDPDEEVSLFRHRAKIADKDAVIADRIWERVQRFAEVDANQIAQGDLQARADGIEGNIEARSIAYP